MLLQPRNSSSKVLGAGDKGLLKPENLRKTCVLAAAYRGHGSVTSLPASAFGPGPHHRHGYSKSA